MSVPHCTQVVRFSWKAELMTRADEVAFTRRLCHEEPAPDLVLVTKGLHDVVFKPRPAARVHTMRRDGCMAVHTMRRDARRCTRGTLGTRGTRGTIGPLRAATDCARCTPFLGCACDAPRAAPKLATGCAPRPVLPLAALHLRCHAVAQGLCTLDARLPSGRPTPKAPSMDPSLRAPCAVLALRTHG